ncbi:MAG TPA: hypothetical protein VGH08_10855 [Chthoniobacterales bacterium]|jgi:hypothetical protein
MSQSRRELNSTVVNIELTLASIIQGVALYFLTENTRTILSERNWGSLLYAAAGLAVIFIFWSRSIIHTLTLIKWPLEFGHNFFYIACAFGEAILFTHLARAAAWFWLSSVYAGIVWLLFIYDMRLIHACLREAASDAERALYVCAKRDQLLNISVLLPLLFIFNLVCALAIHRWPEYFIFSHGHIWLICAQLLSFLFYLGYVTRFFIRIAPLILHSRESG